MLRGIFCLEVGDWSNNLQKHPTVHPLLDLLGQPQSGGIRSIYRDVATKEELEFYLRLWLQQRYGKSYPILYLAFHGAQGEISGPKGTLVSLDELSAMLEGKCKGRVIHFGSCSTLDLHGNRLNTFLAATQAKAVSGYTKVVDWNLSLLLEILWLQELATHSFRSIAGPQAAEAHVRELIPKICDGQGFRVEPRRGR